MQNSLHILHSDEKPNQEINFFKREWRRDFYIFQGQAITVTSLFILFPAFPH